MLKKALGNPKAFKLDILFKGHNHLLKAILVKID